MLPEDENVAAKLEDVSATAVQRIARGKAARLSVRRLRGVYARAATVIQGGARGMFVRRRGMRTQSNAVVMIQRQMRAKLARLERERAVSSSRRGKAVSSISRVYRGMRVYVSGSGARRAKKAGGGLQKLTTAPTLGREKAPARRARIDADVARARAETARLERELSKARHVMTSSSKL